MRQECAPLLQAVREGGATSCCQSAEDPEHFVLPVKNKPTTPKHLRKEVELFSSQSSAKQSVISSTDGRYAACPACTVLPRFGEASSSAGVTPHPASSGPKAS